MEAPGFDSNNSCKLIHFSDANRNEWGQREPTSTVFAKTYPHQGPDLILLSNANQVNQLWTHERLIRDCYRASSCSLRRGFEIN